MAALEALLWFLPTVPPPIRALNAWPTVPIGPRAIPTEADEPPLPPPPTLLALIVIVALIPSIVATAARAAATAGLALPSIVLVAGREANICKPITTPVATVASALTGLVTGSAAVVATWSTAVVSISTVPLILKPAAPAIPETTLPIVFSASPTTSGLMLICCWISAGAGLIFFKFSICCWILAFVSSSLTWPSNSNRISFWTSLGIPSMSCLINCSTNSVIASIPITSFSPRPATTRIAFSISTASSEPLSRNDWICLPTAFTSTEPSSLI